MNNEGQPVRSVAIIGAGIAGLSTGIYAQRAGYHSQIYEMHTLPGGLMTSWKRKGYTIDGCIHWLTWAKPNGQNYRLWEEIGLLHGQTIFDPEVFMVYESRDGRKVTFYTDLDRLERHLTEIGPEDAQVIHKMCADARLMIGFEPPAGPTGHPLKDLGGMMAMLPKMLRGFPVMRHWSNLSLGEFGRQFKNPLLAEAFSEVWGPEMSAGALVLTFAGLHDHSAGYPIGGSLPMALSVEKRYRELGGEIHYGCRVERILVENGRAVGLRLEDGQEVRADAVVSAADGHATLFDLLEGRYLTDEFRKLYAESPIFPSILHIGLGVNRRFDDLPGATAGFSFPIEQPIQIAGRKLDRLELMVYNFDPTLAPAGKTVLALMIPTNYQYWKELAGEPERYQAEKERIGLEIIQNLDRRFPGLAGQVEMADVATPMTFERFTGNWQGSYEGFLPVPGTLMTTIPKTLPGLEQFYMAGQWVQVGGGLPSGLITGRDVIRLMCKRDGVKFR